MKTKSKLALLVIILLLAGGAGTVYYKSVNTSSDVAFGWKFPVSYQVSFSQSEGYSKVRDFGGAPKGFPVRLNIPVIGVDSAIEDALITQDGRMDVPAGSVNVAWFALGPHPGEIGNAVIGGHFGMTNGVPFVFYDLDKLIAGDIVYVINDKGDRLAFVVRSIELFDRDADATSVFTSDDGLAHLNLITCEGVWNQIDDSYPKRRVVFTDAISAKASVPTPAPLPQRTTNAWGVFVSILRYLLRF